MKNNQCNNWHESDLIDLNGNRDQCIHAATYAEAQAICAMNSAYVCTRDQVLNGCAEGELYIQIDNSYFIFHIHYL